VSPTSAHPEDHIHVPIPESCRTVPDGLICLQSTPIPLNRRRPVSIDADYTQSTPIYLQIGKKIQ
ncbi:hypothetical protein KI387_029225, partial [Taxus chinensis]